MVGRDSSFQGAQKPQVLQLVLLYSSASLADKLGEPLFSSGAASATGVVSCPQPVWQPVPPVTTQVASSTALVFHTLQPPKHMSQTASFKPHTLGLSASVTTGPTTAPPSQASNWDPSPQTGDQGYISPVIDLYPERDSNLEALCEDSPADQEPVSYEDILDAPSSTEADPAEVESICSEYKSCRESVCAVRSYIHTFIPEL